MFRSFEHGQVTRCSIFGTLILGDLFEYQDLWRIEVKGLADPVQAYQVLRTSSVESRFEALRTTTTPLIGRDEEIEILRALLGPKSA
jgi:hypothetical protein